MRSNWKLQLPVTIAAMVANVCLAQFLDNRQFPDNHQHWSRPREDGPIYYTEAPNVVPVDSRTVRTAREIATHSTTDAPAWTNMVPGFEKDVFTFVRIIRDRDPLSSPRAGPWVVDFPDSDLNFSYRLQQVTTI